MIHQVEQADFVADGWIHDGRILQSVPQCLVIHENIGGACPIKRGAEPIPVVNQFRFLHEC